MKIVTWNVNGIRAAVKKNFFEAVESLAPDILCIQETKAQPAEVEKALAPLQADYHHYYNSASKKGYSSTALLTKIVPEKVVNDMGVAEHDDEGRIICAEYQDFFLVNVYVPNSGDGLKRLDYRATWDRDFRNYLVELKNKKPVIVTGDFNVAHQAIDLKNDKSNYNKTAGYTQVEIDGFQALLDAGFVDVFRHLYPDVVKYTYWSYRFNARKNNAGWRIDYFLVTPDLMDRVEDVVIHNEIYGSDHCPVSMILK